MNRRSLVIIGSLLLPLGCGGADDPTSPTANTLAVTTPSLTDGTESRDYLQTLAASGGDGSYTWAVSIDSLPAGLSLSASTGVISGTVTTRLSSTFTVEVASGDGQTASRELTITVHAVLLPSELCSNFTPRSIAAFEDANLEAVIRAAGIGPGDITCGSVWGLTGLTGLRAGITSLVGIQNLTNATDIFLLGNSISDLSPLSGLTRLVRLTLDENSITDISALGGLVELETLRLAFNSITDISALSGLSLLTGIVLDSNAITDIRALGELRLNSSVSLDGNRDLADIRPLLDNAAFGSGARVWLTSTNVSCADIALLQAKGVRVVSDCP